MKEILTIEKLVESTKQFCDEERRISFHELIGIDNGKTIGTFVEHRLQNYLAERYEVPIGNSASGIDLPSNDINTDIKVTSAKQPQSSSPFTNARQKIFGLGYNLLVLVYEKIDSQSNCYLNYLNCTFIDSSRTADFTTTKRLMEMLNDDANKDDIVGYLIDKNIPGDEITLNQLAEEIFAQGVVQGYLTISNALQWRLQYNRAISLDNSIQGVVNYDISK